MKGLFKKLKKTPKGIIALSLVFVMVISAFARIGWITYPSEQDKAWLDFSFSDKVNAVLDRREVKPTGLSVELTFTEITLHSTPIPSNHMYDYPSINFV